MINVRREGHFQARESTLHTALAAFNGAGLEKTRGHLGAARRERLRGRATKETPSTANSWERALIQNLPAALERGGDDQIGFNDVHLQARSEIRI